MKVETRQRIERQIARKAAKDLIAAGYKVMHGTEDRLIPPANSEQLASHITGARLILYPEAGHLFFIEKADEVNGDIRAFLMETS